MLPYGAPFLAPQILDETADGVLVTDQFRPDSPIIHANASFCRMTGYPLAEVLGQSCRFLQGTDREQPEIAAMRDAIAMGRPAVVVLRNYRQDGSMFWNEVRLAPLWEPDHPDALPRYYVGFQRDVSDRVSASMELRRAWRLAEEANAARLHFLTAMGHEFRTPIGIIIGFSELLVAAAERGTPEAGQLAYLRDIRGAAHHLLMMVEDARRFLQVNAPADLKRERVPLSRAIEGAALRVEPVLRDLGAKLQVMASGHVEVEADLPMLQQALVGLIAELARRVLRGGDIVIELHPDEEQAVVEIRCPTLVLPEATIASLGGSLQGENILNRGLEGAGVSMVVSERIIRFHGGALTIWSGAEAGTAVRVALPRAGWRQPNGAEERRVHPGSHPVAVCAAPCKAGW